MIGIAGYGASTAAGPGVEALWEAVVTGRDLSPAHWSEAAGSRSVSSFERLLNHLLLSFREARESVDLVTLGRLGVILASTKGFVEDVVWSSAEGLMDQDLIAPLLPAFCERAELKPTTTAVISNACSSSLSALWLAQAWLKEKRCDTVLVLAVDEAGEFVHRGFRSLMALASGTCKPFAPDRDGLKLGSGAAALFVTANTNWARTILSGVAVDAEGYALTRPAPSGDSLRRCLRALPKAPPDFIIAHGTGTVLNDAVESSVFFTEYGATPWISGSKWSIGHTLAACGALDVILASESILRGSVFHLANTALADVQFQSRFCLAASDIHHAPERVLVTSLGFGGVHAAALVERAPSVERSFV